MLTRAVLRGQQNSQYLYSAAQSLQVPHSLYPFEDHKKPMK